MEARCVADVKAVLGEGPVWVDREQAIYWVDIKGRKIFRLSENQDLAVWPTPFRVGSLAPRAEGGFIAGTDHGFAIVDLDANRFEPVAHPETDRPDNRFNDGKVDRSGRFWAGTMDDLEQQASGALYRLGADLAWTRADDGYKVTNGPAFSPDGRTLYHTDSALQTIYAFDLDEDGNASNRREFARFGDGDGYPDGMTVDSEGCLWVAFWDGWCVRRLSSSGEPIAKLDLPVQRPTSCAFGGAGLNRLYVSSARVDLTDDELAVQPYAGGLFLLTPGVSGVAQVPFAG